MMEEGSLAWVAEVAEGMGARVSGSVAREEEMEAKAMEAGAMAVVMEKEGLVALVTEVLEMVAEGMGKGMVTEGMVAEGMGVGGMEAEGMGKGMVGSLGKGVTEVV